MWSIPCVAWLGGVSPCPLPGWKHAGVIGNGPATAVGTQDPFYTATSLPIIWSHCPKINWSSGPWLHCKCVDGRKWIRKCVATNSGESTSNHLDIGIARYVCTLNKAPVVGDAAVIRVCGKSPIYFARR